MVRSLLGQLQDELLDESCAVRIRAHLTSPFPDAEDFGLDFDLHVLLDLHLTGQAAAFSFLATSDVGLLRRQNGTAAVMDVNFANATRSTTAAGGG